MNVFASDFASLNDLAAYQRAKAQGMSDAKAFAVGDNGIGCWGDLTAQEHTPMCALPPETMTKFFGSLKAAKHRGVVVCDVATGIQCQCIVADRMPALANIKNGCGIDLNPAALKLLKLKSPIKRKVDISPA